MADEEGGAGTTGGPRLATISISEELRRHYGGYYGGASEWRRVGALDKAENVLALCRDVPHRSVVDIGAGEGSLLARLAELRFAQTWAALDVSASGVAAIRAREIAGLAHCEVFDGYAIPFEDGRFDLALLSHVLEHAEHPRALLVEAARVARHVLLEVPLEDHWRLPRDFRPDAVGHINFWRPKSLRRFVQSSGLVVVAERVSHPSRRAYAARRGAGPASAWLRWAPKQALLALAPGLAVRLSTYHGALLCRRAG